LELAAAAPQELAPAAPLELAAAAPLELAPAAPLELAAAAPLELAPATHEPNEARPTTEPAVALPMPEAAVVPPTPEPTIAPPKPQQRVYPDRKVLGAVVPFPENGARVQLHLEDSDENTYRMCHGAVGLVMQHEVLDGKSHWHVLCGSCTFVVENARIREPPTDDEAGSEPESDSDSDSEAASARFATRVE
jgi:hypothetical protein